MHRSLYGSFPPRTALAVSADSICVTLSFSAVAAPTLFTDNGTTIGQHPSYGAPYTDLWRSGSGSSPPQIVFIPRETGGTHDE